MPKPEKELLQINGREVSISNPRKVLFPDAGYTKLDVVNYYLAVAEGALRGAGGRPNVLVRYPNGIEGEFFYQKRAPESRPAWLDVVTLRFPSGRTAVEVVPREAAALVWMANLACLELHPHPVRADDLDHPDELRIDLDPVPGVTWEQMRQVARVVRTTLADFALVGWPKTSGSRGMHVNVRIERRWTFDQVRRAAYHIIAGKGATYYGIGSAVARLLDVILHDQRAVLTICCRIESVPEFQGVTFALPHLVGGAGALATIAPPLDDAERVSLRQSASVLRDAIGALRPAG